MHYKFTHNWDLYRHRANPRAAAGNLNIIYAHTLSVMTRMPPLLSKLTIGIGYTGRRGWRGESSGSIPLNNLPARRGNLAQFIHIPVGGVRESNSCLCMNVKKAKIINRWRHMQPVEFVISP